LTLNDATQYFSYQNVTNGRVEASSVPPVLGTLSTSNGIFNLNATRGQQNPGPGGYVIEIPGRAALLRPGAAFEPLVPSVAANTCVQLNGPTTFQFISLGSPAQFDLNPRVAYGSLQAQSGGTDWSFSNVKMFTVDGTSLPSTSIPAGVCAESLAGSVISIPITQINSLGNSVSGTMTAAVGPSGFFLMDQGQGNPLLDGAYAGSAGPYGLVGIIQPASPIDTSSVVGKKYLGFKYNPINTIDLGIKDTWPLSFGQIAGTGTTLIGGAFPNDDITQIPATNISIDLGAQDPQNNGLYKSVTVTLPDSYAACSGQPYGGTDASGQPTCVFPGVAVVGTAEGKYAIFVVANDKSLATRGYTPLATFDLILYQQ
jgi:hypothetical protein